MGGGGGHAAVLHACDWAAALFAAHALPPPDAAVETVYWRDCLPPPHVALQPPQLPQEPAQLTTGAGAGGGGVAAFTVIVLETSVWYEL